MATRILIVDDSPLVRQRLRVLLLQHPEWDVCGEAADGQSAVELASRMAPDLIVLDFVLPGMNGLQTAQEIGRLVPGIPILMFSMHLSRQLIEAARKAGVRGAVAKTDVKHVIPGLEALLRQESFFCMEA